MQIVKLHVREQYGVLRLFPANALASALASLTSYKTIDARQLAIIRRDLGYHIELHDKRARPIFESEFRRLLALAQQ